MDEPRYTREELKRIMKRFAADKNRGISIKLFSELAGMNADFFRDVFIYQTEPLSALMQLRVARAYERFKRGEVKIMAKSNKRWVEYRDKPEPRVKRENRLVLTADGFQLKPGIRLRGDYSQPTLDEQLRSEYDRFA